MATDLPLDIWHVLFDELAFQREFDTLFSCACTCRRLAIPALTYLYRIHHESPVRDGGSEAVPLGQQILTVQKWAILWRSIIASTVGKTLFPYCKYIRVLELRDLSNLIDDDKFNQKISQELFSGELAKFKISLETPAGRKSGRKNTQLNVVAILDAIGEAITKHTPMLEHISGDLLSNALIRWAPRLPNLRSLHLWRGNPLGDVHVQEAIRTNCPHFDALSMYSWVEEGSDSKLASFINNVRPNSLRSFVTFSNTGISAKSLLALSGHGGSLRELKLNLNTDALPHLGLLSECDTLEVITLISVDRRVSLDATQNDGLVHEVIAWLKKCQKLRQLTLHGFALGAKIVTPLLLEPKVELEKLDVDNYVVKENRAFHQALPNQQSLRGLFLEGDSEGMFRDDIDILLDSLKQLNGLRELELRGVSDFLVDEHINQIAQSLTHLEDLYISGLSASDVALLGVAELKNLRRITFNALSSFTLDGLLNFVSKLGPGNQGLVLTVDMADPSNYLLTAQEQDFIRETLHAQVGGNFEYTLWRDPDISEYEGESD